MPKAYMHPLVSITFGVALYTGFFFVWMQEKGNAACDLLLKGKFISQNWVYWTPNGPV